MKYFLLILITIGAAVFVLPASAAIVPCTTNCTICDLLKLVQNIINFFLSVSVPLATAMILAGGILILTAGDSQKRLEWGKTILTNAIVGFAIILAGWLFINTILLWLINPELSSKIFPWNEIQCQSSIPTQTATSTSTTTQSQQQEWPSEQRFAEQYQQQQQQQSSQQTATTQTQPTQPIIIPNLTNVSWTENETNSGEVATLRMNIEMLETSQPPIIYDKKTYQQAFSGDIFKQLKKPGSMINYFFNNIMKLTDPFCLILPTPKPTSKPKPVITPKIIKTPTPTPTPKTTPKIGQITPTPIPKKQQPKNFYFTYDFYDAKSDKKIDSVDAMFFLSDLMATRNQMFQWNIPDLPKNTQIKSQVKIKDEYGTNYGSYWSNTITVNPYQQGAAEKCVKIAGNGPIRIVMMPIAVENKEFDSPCFWKEEQIQSGEWASFVKNYENTLSVYPFTPSNFSLWRYDALSHYNQAPCGVTEKVYVYNCVGRPSAYYKREIPYEGTVPGGHEVFLYVNYKNYKVLLHELGHSFGGLYDEYDPTVSDTTGSVPLYSLGPRNCVSLYDEQGNRVSCPGWWQQYGAQCIEGCNYETTGWARDHREDLMRSLVPNFFGPVDLRYLEMMLAVSK